MSWTWCGCTRRQSTSSSRTRRPRHRRSPGIRARSSTCRSGASRSSEVHGHPSPVQPAGGAFYFGESMSEEAALLHKPADEISAEALQRAEEMIEKEEGVQNKLVGWIAAFVTAVAVVMSLFHLYTAYAIVRPEHLRSIHLAFVLFLTFLIFPAAGRFRHRIMWWDWLLSLTGVATTVYLIIGGDE